MQNPFVYGHVVTNSAFCNRRQEARDLRRTIEGAGRLFLYAERRMGKTSLVKRVLAELPSGECVAAYVDLWSTDSPAGFTKALAKALAGATSTTAGRMLETAREFFASLRPDVTVDESGAPMLTFGANVPTGSESELDEVLAAPARLAKKGKRVAIVFDEFQEVAAYDEDLVERKLRSVIQHQSEVAYLFIGSRKHFIQETFLDSGCPLYRSAEHYPLEAIAENHWQPFIEERFARAAKTITKEQISKICRLTEGHPFYVQHLCHVLWERCEKGARVSEEAIKEAVDVLLGRESYAYVALWESLTQNQRRFLRGLAAEPEGTQPFSADFVQRYRLGSPSSVQRAAEALLARELIDRKNSSLVVLDRFFRLWITRWQQP